MSLKAAIALLSLEIEEIQGRIGSQLEKDRELRRPTEMQLLRAKSLGRSLLRAAEALGLEDPIDFDQFYKAALRRMKLVDPDA